MQVFSRKNLVIKAVPAINGHVISSLAPRGRNPLEDFTATPVCMYYTPLTAAQPG
jgi:hypothetical protein